MRLSSFFYLHKSDRRIALTFLTVIVILTGCLYFFDEKGSSLLAEQREATDSVVVKGGERPTDDAENDGQQATRKVERFGFDPNTADSTALLRLGLQPYQVRNIYKYRAAGGIYRQKEDFAQLYGLTLKEYRELEPYIQISADYRPAAEVVKPVRKEGDTLRYSTKLTEGMTINAALADTAQLRQVPGIGFYFARQIVRYRERLGGFVSIDQLDEIDGFPTEAKKFLTLDSGKPLRKLNLNKLSLDELKRHPYINYYQARAIVEFRRTNGKLTSLDDLQLMHDFTSEARQRLAPYIEF